MRRIRSTILAGLVLLAAPAGADITAFNNAVSAGDYKTAAAAAKATWPTLDKSRPDIGLIAREFGFAALAAEDNQAAIDFAAFAAASAGETAEALDVRQGGRVIQRTAELKARPGIGAHKALADAMAAVPIAHGLDPIMGRGVGALVGYDLHAGTWRDLQKDAEMGEQLADASPSAKLPAGLAALRNYQLIEHIGAFLEHDRQDAVLVKFTALLDTLADDINAAPTEADASRFAPIYWQARAWTEAISVHFDKSLAPISEAEKAPRYETERISHLLGVEAPEEACRPVLEMSPLPVYPPFAIYRRLVGDVVVKVDVDAAGATSNARLLASTPDPAFGEAVMKAIGHLRFKPSDKWDTGKCTLAKKGLPVSFPFIIR
jgi:TonB family protein